jgi:hypothetical protein
LDDSTAIIKRSAMANRAPTTEGSAVASSVSSIRQLAVRQKNLKKEDPERDGAVDAGGRAIAADEVAWCQD